MAVTKKELLEYGFKRNKTEDKKYKNEFKLDGKIRTAFKRLNNRKCYKFFDDPKNKSFHNLLQFLMLLQKKCEMVYGVQKKYKKSEVENVLQDIFIDATNAQAYTLKKINKAMKKWGNDEKFAEFKFNGIMKSDEFKPLEREYRLGLNNGIIGEDYY